MTIVGHYNRTIFVQVLDDLLQLLRGEGSPRSIAMCSDWVMSMARSRLRRGHRMFCAARSPARRSGGQTVAVVGVGRGRVGGRGVMSDGVRLSQEGDRAAVSPKHPSAHEREPGPRAHSRRGGPEKKPESGKVVPGRGGRIVPCSINRSSP